MAIKPIGDLNTGRRLGDDFVVTLARRRNEAGELVYLVLVTAALLAGEVVVGNWDAEDITDRLTTSQKQLAQNLASAAEGKVMALLGL